MTIVEPKPEFRELAESAVRAALNDDNPGNPIAVDVARLIAGYIGNFERQVKRLGYVPTDVLHIKPRWPIEAVAMRLTTETIREELKKGAGT